MKNILLIFTLSLLTINSIFAQADSSAKRFRHEFGIDVSSILGDGLVPNAFGFSTVESYAYPLSYRFYTPWANLRVGAGIASAKEVYSSYFSNNGLDTLEGNDMVLNSRVGLEKMHHISKRWAFFYGLDYEYTRYNDFRESKSVSQGFETDWVSESRRHGFSPLLGFRINFNDRIGLQTELKLTYAINNQTSSREYTAIVPNPSNLPENYKIFTKTTTFNIVKPDFLILTVKL